jgi:hypothetical protein
MGTALVTVKRKGNKITIRDSKELKKKSKNLKKKFDETEKLAAEYLMEDGQEAQDIQNVKSIFAKRKKKIALYLNNDDLDRATILITKQLIKTLMDLIPIAEKKYRRYGNERSAYALNSLVSQVRELMTDMEAYKDRKALVTRLLNDIIRPNFMTMAQQLMTASVRMNQQISSYVDTKNHAKVTESVNNMIKEVARYMDGIYKEIEGKTHKQLGE